MLSPRQIFEDNIRPADLLLKVFRLLEHDALNTETTLLKSLREIVKAEDGEGLIVIYNEIFLGLIREAKTRLSDPGFFFLTGFGLSARP